MKVTLDTLVNAQGAMARLGNLANLPGRMKYRIGTHNEELYEELIKGYFKTQKSILKDCGNPKQLNGRILWTDPEKEAKYDLEIQDVLDIEKDVDFWPIDISELGKIDDTNEPDIRGLTSTDLKWLRRLMLTTKAWDKEFEKELQKEKKEDADKD